MDKKEYIERGELLASLENTPKYFLKLAILNAPAADVVEVVRCKDCAVPHNKWTGCPNLNGLIPPPDFYCAKGERKVGK